ncbi:MAG: hypothetical protein RIR73_2888 [Chloroflexota bacterium]
MAPKTKKTTTKASKPTRAATSSAPSTRTKSAAKQGKPFFRTGTWVALLVFAAIIAAIIYLNQNPIEDAEAEISPIAEEAPLFATGSVVSSIEVKPLEGEAVQLERNESQAWVLTQPDEVEADQGMAEAAASQVTALRIITEVDNKKDPSIFGFDQPAFILTIGFEDGTTSTLEVGDTTPSENGYYVRVDNDKFYVVSLSGIGALTNLASVVPYLNTPTPIPTATSTPLPTETPVPATEISPTP